MMQRGVAPLIVAAKVLVCLASLALSYSELKQGENQEVG